MLTIAHLRLHLPAECRDRAHLIARRVANELTRSPAESDATIDRLRVPPVTIAPGTGDGQIARRIAAAVRKQLNGKGASDSQAFDPGRQA
jgi:hypothetical protein